MKKAVLVEFAIRTRVIVDSKMSEEDVANIAINNIFNNGAENYIIPDNLVSVEDDTECPYEKGEEM